MHIWSDIRLWVLSIITIIIQHNPTTLRSLERKFKKWLFPCFIFVKLKLAFPGCDVFIYFMLSVVYEARADVHLRKCCQSHSSSVVTTVSESDCLFIHSFFLNTTTHLFDWRQKPSLSGLNTEKRNTCKDQICFWSFFFLSEAGHTVHFYNRTVWEKVFSLRFMRCSYLLKWVSPCRLFL